mgnify:FL=1|jgi:hypothetical protein
MASTYVNNLRLNEMATGDGSGTWGTTTNLNLELIGQALGWGTRAVANASTDNITIADGAADSDRSMALKLTGGGQACTITILPNTSSKVWFMFNATSYTLTFTCGSGANIAIPAGTTKIIATDGLGSGGVVYDVLTDPSFTGNLNLNSDSAVLKFGADADTTLTHTDGTGLTLNSTNKLCFNDASQFIQGASATVLDIAATDEIELTATLIDVVGNFTNSGTIISTGVVTANAGVVVDEMTLDADTLTATDDFIIDAVGDITLDAAGDDILLKSAGTHEGNINLASSNLTFKSIVSDKDMIFQGNDGGSAITALTLDMSAAGAATFNNDVTAFSDERLKSNITTIPNALSKVTKMRGVHYVRDATGKDSTGVIAQEMQKVAPELVLTAEDEMGTLSVNYGNITGYLIEAIKELSARVKELEAK